MICRNSIGVTMHATFLGLVLFSHAVFLIHNSIIEAYAIETFSVESPPAGIPYDEWISQYWNWWISKTTQEAYPQDGACIMNATERMVMLMETASGGTRNLECNIKSNQAIMIPIWIGWCDTSPRGEKPPEGLLNCAKGANLGRIESTVRVDNNPVPVASLDVTMTSSGPSVNSMVNVTELSTGEFKLVIPGDSHKVQFTAPGEWLAASHGWWVFLNPLPPGRHEVYYDVGVDKELASGTSAAFTYTLNVS